MDLNTFRNNEIVIVKNLITFIFIFTLILLSSRVTIAEGTDKEVTYNISKLLKTKSCVRCNLEKADLNRAELANANLSGANLSNATFFLANLTGANFQNSVLLKAEFGGADVSKADFRGANITSASFSGAYKRGAFFDKTTNNYASSTTVLNENVNDDASNTKTTQITKSQETQLTSHTQPDKIKSGGILPSASNGPPLKKIKPISKAIFSSN